MRNVSKIPKFRTILQLEEHSLVARYHVEQRIIIDIEIDIYDLQQKISCIIKLKDFVNTFCLYKVSLTDVISVSCSDVMPSLSPVDSGSIALRLMKVGRTGETSRDFVCVFPGP